MSLKNSTVIFYLCATSTTAILLVTFGANAASAANIEMSHQRIAPSLNGFANNDVITANIGKSNRSTVEKSGTLNGSHVNNANHIVIALPSSDNRITHANNGHSASQSDNVENSESHLHLNEYNIVATTPKILTTKLPNRYEQGLEDYEEAAARVEEQRGQTSDGLRGLESVLSFVETAGNVWNKVSTEYQAKQATSQPTITDKSDNGSANNNNKIDGNGIGEARYIQGDPLKGYYDFIITEGSYKFWAAFQLFTAGLMIYSTFAAIYYSKVNPVVSYYDYQGYLGGSRSLADDPEPIESASVPWSDIANSYIFQRASHGFQFVLDAIEKIPKS